MKKSPVIKNLRGMNYDKLVDINNKLVKSVALMQQENKNLYTMINYYKDERNRLIEVKIARLWHKVKMLVFNPIITFTSKHQENNLCIWVYDKLTD